MERCLSNVVGRVWIRFVFQQEGYAIRPPIGGRPNERSSIVVDSFCMYIRSSGDKSLGNVQMMFINCQWESGAARLAGPARAKIRIGTVSKEQINQICFSQVSRCGQRGRA